MRYLIGGIFLLISIWQFIVTGRTFAYLKKEGGKRTSPFILLGLWSSFSVCYYFICCGDCFFLLCEFLRQVYFIFFLIKQRKTSQKIRDVFVAHLSKWNDIAKLLIGNLLFFQMVFPQK